LSDEIITRLELIQELARKRQRSDVRFRTWVKCHDMSDPKLDAIVAETAAEVEQLVDCTQCANCCRTMEVVVDSQDIRRLAAYLSISPAELERRYVKTGRDGVKHFASRPCPMLDGNRCSVYVHRPKACRDFPYLHAEGFRKRMLLTIDNTAVCPIVFNTFDRLKRRLGFREKG
jgi:Fe-S-cluster containining protein